MLSTNCVEVNSGPQDLAEGGRGSAMKVAELDGMCTGIHQFIYCSPARSLVSRKKSCVNVIALSAGNYEQDL